MPINLSNFAPQVTKAVSLSNLVLVTPKAVQGYQPQNPPNADGTVSTAERPPAFLFNYEGEQKITLRSDITDHYSEDNRALQDQIALAPELFQTQGYIGELNTVPPPGLDVLKEIANRLTNVEAFAPQLSASALIAYNNAFATYQAAKNIANTAVSAWSSLGNALTGESGQSVIGPDGLKVGTNQNKQQQAFQQFYGYWAARTLFTIQTPWAVFEDMAIQEVVPVQNAEDNQTTTFNVTFKRMRFAETIIAGVFGASALDGRAASQAAGLTDLGVSSPVPSTSLSAGLSSVFG